MMKCADLSSFVDKIVGQTQMGCIVPVNKKCEVGFVLLDGAVAS